MLTNCRSRLPLIVNYQSDSFVEARTMPTATERLLSAIIFASASSFANRFYYVL